VARLTGNRGSGSQTTITGASGTTTSSSNGATTSETKNAAIGNTPGSGLVLAVFAAGFFL